MDENIYSLIFLLLFIVLLMTGSSESANTTGEDSELHAANRYAVADQCLAEYFAG